MDNDREHVRGKIPAWLALVLLAGLSGGAQAGDRHASFSVALRLGGWCLVARPPAGEPAGEPLAPLVECRAASPPLVHVRRADGSLPGVRSEGAGTVIVTLVF